VWFSRYFAYKQSDYPPLLRKFRAERVPLDVLPVDTDFKSPHNWNGWGWNRALFPDPPGFFAWAKREGIDVGLNTHPSISGDDPQLPAAERRAGRTLPGDPTLVRCIAITAGAGLLGTGFPDITPGCRVFDFARAGDQAAYFGLHEPFERAGNDFWWLDYCCDESYALAPGLTQDTWMNQLYADRSRARGSRWPVLSRIGASFFEVDSGTGSGVWAEHRNTIHFTGDTLPRWEMLDFQTAFTAAEGNVGIPYVSHDIGSFAGPTSSGASPRRLADDLYVRWIQSGAFQPILRLHSDHGLRLPWDYGGRAEQVATRFLQLRGELLPYLYTLAREANVSGLPLARAMYLGWPGREEAYRFPHQYTLGRDLLVAPVGTPGDPAVKEVWFPPGTWTDIFTGARHRGPAAKRLAVPLDRMPVFARAGAVLPLQGYRPEGNERPASRLIVEAYPGRRGSATLYEDEGDGLAYRSGRSARTRLAQRRTAKQVSVSLGRARGRYRGAPRCRRFEVRVHGVRRPRAVSFGRLRYERARRTATVTTGCLRVSTTRVLTLRLG
jgi:alpha-glucosidase (family GH31 glycosyl hydrolase)